MFDRAMFVRVRSALAPALLGLLAATACAPDFDTNRKVNTGKTLGVDLFGVVCDRMGGQSLHEDLTGASFAAICHGDDGAGAFGDDTFKVDTSQLPTINGPRPKLGGGTVTEAEQTADRTYGVARLERLAQDRAKLIAALDATFPDIKVDIKNLTASDPTQSCAKASQQGTLHHELANLLGRFTALYDDGTIPASTEGLGAVASSVNQSTDAQSSWVHFNARAGYRPFGLAMGALRPFIAYPSLRPLVQTLVANVAADSQPYQLNPTVKNGKRVPVPGKAYPAMAAFSAAAHIDFAHESADPVPSPLVLSRSTDPSLGTVLNRPMTDLEVVQSVLFDTDPAYSAGIYANGSPYTPNYIVQRDARGYALVPVSKGAVPSPFVIGSDGLAQVDASGAFMTSGGKPAPTPFSLDPMDTSGRDQYGRAMNGTTPLYSYLDTNQSFLSVVLAHVRGVVNGNKSLVDSNPADNHETVLDSLAGAYVLFGDRDPMAQRTYGSDPITFSGYKPVGSPLGDLIYAMGQLLADPATDPGLSLLSTLTTQHTTDAARVIGDALYDKAQSDKHPESKIPAQSTFWDEMIDLLVAIAQDTSAPDTSVPANGIQGVTGAPASSGTGTGMGGTTGTPAGGTRLLEDILTAFADPASANLSKGLQQQAAFIDDITYDRTNINGPVVNGTTKDGSLPKTPSDHTKPDANANRSELQRFAQLTHDTNGVTLCNKEGAVLHAVGTTLGTLNACASTDPNGVGQLCTSPDTACTCGGGRPFHECEMLKINNLAAFYLDSIAGRASLYFRNHLARDGLIANLGATSVSVTEQSSQLGLHPAPSSSTPNPTPDDTYNGPMNTDPTAPGFWDPLATIWNPTATPPTYLRPKPAWLSRLIHFDIVNDSAMSGTNHITNQFIADLQGNHVGTVVCPERVIADPCANNKNCFDRMEDNDVASDGMVHGLRNCPDGDWLYQRDQDVLFNLEENGFLAALTPLATAFANHHREDLFIQLMETLNKHWQTAAGASMSPDECKLTPSTNCAKDGASTYEPILSAIFGSDLFTGLNNLSSIAKGIMVPTCSAVDPSKHTCTTAGPTLNGIQVLASLLRNISDPNVAKGYALKDSKGGVTAPRNDGKTNPQVTPLYLLLDALDEIDAALNANDADPMATDKTRYAKWKLGRSQLVDEILTVKGVDATTGKVTNAAFADPTFVKIAPVIIDTLRSQVLGECGKDFTTGKCAWARGVTPSSSCPPGMVSGGTGPNGCHVPVALWNEAVASMGSPLFSSALDLADATRLDDPSRASLEALLAYLVDPKATDANNIAEALTELQSTAHDMLQVLRNDADLVPVYQALAPAFVPPPNYTGQPNLVDASTALFVRLAGQAFDDKGHEICAKELDPNNVLDVALANLMTPMPNDAPVPGNPGVTPFEVVVDTIADVNRASPSNTTDPLAAPDYANISNELNEFLTDPQRGLEQFYAIVRNATEPQ